MSVDWDRPEVAGRWQNDAIDPQRTFDRLDLHRKKAYSRVEKIGDGIENEAARIYRTDQHVGGMASRGAVTAVADVGVAQLK
jgi:hypothetical protein